MIPQDVMDATTLVAIEKGAKVLQGHRLADTDRDHVSALLAYMQPPHGSMILDVGCGFGEVARLMVDERPDLDFVLVNNNALQLDHAPYKFRKWLASADNIPASDSTFDGVMFNYALCQMPILEALTEAANATKTGGFLFIYDFDRIGGNNDLFFTRLFGNALPWSTMKWVAETAGWKIESHEVLDTDDSLFRAAYANDAEYDEIFQHLVVSVWRAVKA